MSKLYFYYSVMDGGKSAHIIMQVHKLRNKGYNVLALKPKRDTRDYGVIRSRALSTEVEAMLIDGNTDVFELVKNISPDYVFVDEVNFLSEQNVEDLAMIVDELDIPVFGYGLLTDYKGQLFEGSKRMMELADSRREIQSPCDHCKRKATMHLHKVNGEYVFEGESIKVGDKGDYESVCRRCYMKVKKRKEKNRHKK